MSAYTLADRSPLVLDEQNRPSASHASTSHGRWMRWGVFLLIAFFGLLVRLPQLSERPMHTDEAVNAYILGEVLARKPFNYDPRDRHGPMLAALALPLARMQGARAFSELTESELRLTPVLAGSITILLFGAGVEMFGFVPCVIAAMLFAGAPLPVYYDRYFIHESIFVAVTFGLMLAGWRACQRRSIGYATTTAICAALMLTSKETAVLHFTALILAALLFWLWNLRGKHSAGWWQPRAALVAAVVFVLVSVILFTWFGSNWKALTALLEAFPNFAARAHDGSHQGPLLYYFRLLTSGWSGGVIFALACIGFILTVIKRTASPHAFLTFYAVSIALFYSLIPYKTPWLALNFWLPIALFVGVAIDWVWRLPAHHSSLRTSIRVACLFGCAGIAMLIVHDTRVRVFLHPADEANPYAYAHTSEDLLGLPTEIARIAREEGLAAPRIAVIASDPWPLPWYLRHYAQVGFWQPGQEPGQADFYITSTDAADQYAELLKDFHPQFFGVRPGVLTLLWSPAPK